MADLRETIAQLLGEQFGYSTIIVRQAYKAADAILAIPEIRDALEPLRCNDCGDEVSCAVCCGCAAMGA